MSNRTETTRKKDTAKIVFILQGYENLTKKVSVHQYRFGCKLKNKELRLLYFLHEFILTSTGRNVRKDVSRLSIIGTS